MGEKTEVQKPTEQHGAEARMSSNITRRGLFGIALGAWTALRLGKAKPAGAQTLTENQQVSHRQNQEIKKEVEAPSKLRQGVESAVNLSRKYLEDPVKLKFYQRNSPGVYSTYEATVSGSEQANISLSDFALEVFYTKQESTWDYLKLRSAAEIGKLLNRKGGEHMVEEFARSFEQFSGLSIDDFDPSKTQEKKQTPNKLTSEDAARFEELRTFFDYKNYDENVPGRDVHEELVDLKELLFMRGFSLWLLKSDKLAEKIEATSPKSQKVIANILLSILTITADSIPIGVNYNFNSSGVDQRNIDRMLQISDNPRYKNFFYEKRTIPETFPRAS